MVEFCAMTPADYESWRRASIRSYAEENVAAGRWTREEADSRSEQDFASLLPDGAATTNNFFFTIVDEHSFERVGVVWYALRREWERDYVFIYDFKIFEAHRRKGYGTEALLHLDDVIRKMGLSLISLHVFGHNRAARDLYAKVGYEEKDVIMSKRLS
jgi:ribosomal protein S18 acetylase RimI-like enzyme